MKKTYPSVLIKGTHDQILKFKNIEFIEWTSHQFINVILGISEPMKNLLYFKSICLSKRDYTNTILGDIHKQLVNHDFPVSLDLPNSGRFQDNSYVKSFYFEIQFLFDSEINLHIAINYEDEKGLPDFWKEYLSYAYPNLQFEFGQIELEEPIYNYESSVIYSYGSDIHELEMDHSEDLTTEFYE